MVIKIRLDSCFIEPEDLKYYTLDPSCKPLEVVNSFYPPKEIVFFNYGHKHQERLIYPTNDDYTDEENHKYNEFTAYLAKKKI